MGIITKDVVQHFLYRAVRFFLMYNLYANLPLNTSFAIFFEVCDMVFRFHLVSGLGGGGEGKIRGSLFSPGYQIHGSPPATTSSVPRYRYGVPHLAASFFWERALHCDGAELVILLWHMLFLLCSGVFRVLALYLSGRL